jgi:hypothetical protein
MPANHSGTGARKLAAQYPDLIGHLFSVEGWRQPFAPYALDNGAYGCFLSGERWSQRAFLGLCEKAASHILEGGAAPLWLAVPDVVANRDETLRSWEGWHRRLRDWYGWPLAFVVQDGMTVGDLPAEADWLFIGGSTRWKWETLATWRGARPRVHVGRVNTYRLLWQAAEAGALSCDGSGWFRGDRAQLAGLRQFLAEYAERPHAAPQMRFMFKDPADTPPSGRADEKGEI